jgi:hypothetical protein
MMMMMMMIKRNTYIIFVGKPEGKTPLGRQGVDWKIILEWILWKQGRMVWTGCIWFRIGVNGRPL